MDSAKRVCTGHATTAARVRAFNFSFGTVITAAHFLPVCTVRSTDVECVVVHRTRIFTESRTSIRPSNSRNGTLSICHIVARAQINENLRWQYCHRCALWSAGAGTFQYIWALRNRQRMNDKEMPKICTQKILRSMSPELNERTSEPTYNS